MALFSLPATVAVLGATTPTIIVSAIVGALALSPFTTALGERLAKLLEQAPDTKDAPTAKAGRILIVGADDAGVAAARCLHEAGADYLLVESDADAFASARAENLSVSYGDPTDTRLLDGAGAKEAKAIFVSPHGASAADLADIVNRRYGDIPVYAASKSAEGAATLKEMGVTPVSYGETQSLAEAVLGFAQTVGAVTGPLYDLRRALLSDEGAAKNTPGDFLPHAS